MESSVRKSTSTQADAGVQRNSDLATGRHLESKASGTSRNYLVRPDPELQLVTTGKITRNVSEQDGRGVILQAMCVARDAERKFRGHDGAHRIRSNSSAYKHLQARGGNQEGTVQQIIFRSTTSPADPLPTSSDGSRSKPDGTRQSTSVTNRVTSK